MQKITPYFPLLRKCTLFAHLSEENIDEALQIMQASLRSYPKGVFLHTADTALTKFGLVLKGSVSVLIDDLDGNRTLMAQVYPGHTFGESICFLHTENPDIYALAEEDCRVLWLSPTALFGEAQTPLFLQIERNFTQMMAERTLIMNNRIQILSKLTLREKLMTYFTFTVRQQGSRQITVPFDREAMATYIGVNRSALSRELSKMKQEGIIDYRKNIFSLNK